MKLSARVKVGMKSRELYKVLMLLGKGPEVGQ